MLINKKQEKLKTKWPLKFSVDLSFHSPKVSSPAVNYRIIIDSFFFSSFSQYFKLAFLRGPDNNLSIFVFSPSFPLSSPSFLHVLYISLRIVAFAFLGLGCIPLYPTPNTQNHSTLTLFHRAEKEERNRAPPDMMWLYIEREKVCLYLLVRQKVVLRLFSVILHQLWWRQNWNNAEQGQKYRRCCRCRCRWFSLCDILMTTAPRQESGMRHREMKDPWKINKSQSIIVTRFTASTVSAAAAQSLIARKKYRNRGITPSNRWRWYWFFCHFPLDHQICMPFFSQEQLKL